MQTSNQTFNLKIGIIGEVRGGALALPSLPIVTPME